MKRIALALALVSSTVLAAGPAAADEYYYQQAYPVGYPAPYPQNNHETLKKVLIGGALVGIGFLAGRLTAPRQPTIVQPPVIQPPIGYPHGGHHHAPQINTRFRPQFQPQFNYRSAGYRGPYSGRF